LVSSTVIKSAQISSPALLVIFTVKVGIKIYCIGCEGRNTQVINLKYFSASRQEQGCSGAGCVGAAFPPFFRYGNVFPHFLIVNFA